MMHVQLLDYTPDTDSATGKKIRENQTKLICCARVEQAFVQMKNLQDWKFDQVNISGIINNHEQYKLVLHMVKIARATLDRGKRVSEVPHAFFSMVENEIYVRESGRPICRLAVSFILSISHPDHLPEFAESFHELSADDYFERPDATVIQLEAPAQQLGPATAR